MPKGYIVARLRQALESICRLRVSPGQTANDQRWNSEFILPPAGGLATLWRALNGVMSKHPLSFGVWKWIGLGLLAAPALNGQTRLTNLWTIAIGNRSDSSPALGSDGRVYFGVRDGKLWAVDANGTVKWVFRADREIKSSPALGMDGTVYFGSRDRCFYAVRADGKLNWKFRTGAWVDSSPALAHDGTVCFGGWDKNFYAFNANGSLRWQFPTAGEIVSSPAIGLDGTIYFGSYDRKLYALGPDGKKRWEFVTGGPILSSPALNQDQCLYFTSVDGCLYTLNLDGSLRWRLRTGGITESSPVIAQEGTIYLGVNHELWAVNPDGTQKWPRWNEEPIEAPPVALANRTVSVFSRAGLLLTLDEKREPVCSYYCDGAGYACQAVGPTGVSYVAERGSLFSALNSTLPLARSPWPKFRGNPRNTGNLADAAGLP